MKTTATLKQSWLTGALVTMLLGFASAGFAAPPAPTPVTPDLIKKAQQEGKVVFYTSVDVAVAEKVAKAFEAKYPGVKAQIERAGSERIFQRLGQEYGSKIYAADVVNTSDAAHFILWKREGLLAPYVPEDVAKHFPAEHKDSDGMYATWRLTLSPIVYNTKLVKPNEAPKSFADLLDPKWKGKMVKAHPGYSGTIVTSTFQVARDLGWSYWEKLSKQSVMQVQSSTEPPKKLAQGERAIMADGNEYNYFQLKEKGAPLEVVYPTEGTPLITSPSAVLKNSPRPNAARLFQSYIHTPEAQQLLIDEGGLRSVHAQTKEKPGRTPLSKIKVMKDDAVAVEKEVETIKSKYAQYFGV
jgi:iron(III) transport system substrate-binding protein